MSAIAVRRILVIRAGAVGDTILLLPALKALRARYPGAYLELMGYPERVEIACHPQHYAHRTSSCEAAGLSALYQKEGTLPEGQRSRLGEFDLIIAFSHDPQGVLAENLRRTGAKRVLVCSPFPAPGQVVHASRHLLASLEALGIRFPGGIEAPEVHFEHEQQRRDDLGIRFPGGIEAPLGLEAQDRARARDFWERLGSAFKRQGGRDPTRRSGDPLGVGETPLHGAGLRVALHAGSGSPKKRWPVERFAQVGRTLAREQEANLLLISGPADRSVVRELAAGLTEEGPVIVEGLSLRTLAAVLEGCDLYLGNDSGISHLAAAVEIHTLALFGPTDPRIWAPLGPKVTLLRGKAPCAPCLPEELRECPFPRCLQTIEVEEVVGAAYPLPTTPQRGSRTPRSWRSAAETRPASRSSSP